VGDHTMQPFVSFFLSCKLSTPHLLQEKRTFFTCHMLQHFYMFQFDVVLLKQKVHLLSCHFSIKVKCKKTRTRNIKITQIKILLKHI
jgi:hypothetical protein